MNKTQMAKVLSWKRNQPLPRGAVVLARRPWDNALVGLIETSLFMKWSPSQVRFWWTDIITNSTLGLQFNVDGMSDAAAHAAHCLAKHPNWEVQIWDAHDPNLPITIDWQDWIETSDKYCHRNPNFTMKE